MKRGGVLPEMPLWIKLAAFAAVGVVVTHAVHLAVGNRVTSRSVAREQEALGRGIAQLAAGEAAEAILVHDFVTLSEIVGRAAKTKGVVYCFVTGEGGVLASSMPGGTPEALVDARRGVVAGPIVVAGGGARYLDIEEPILEGRAGYVRLGIDMASLQSTRRQIAVPLGVLAVAVILGGVGAGVLVARRVTRPIEALVRAADFFGPSADVPPIEPRGGREISRLGDRFNRMMLRLRSAHEEQERARQKAVATERLAALGSLVSGVAHEVNNPLAGLKNCVHALRLPDLAPDTRAEYLDLMDEGLDRIRDVVRRLLEFGRPRSLSLAPVRAVDLVAEGSRLVAASLRRRHVVVVTVPDPGTEDALVIADRVQIAQALLNLVLNAAYVTPDGGQIRVRVRRRPGAVGIAVEDDGPGIPEDVRGRMLDPFFSTKPEGEGTGLGLSVTRTIVDAHGGDLEFSCPERGGTTATIWLRTSEGPATALGTAS